MNYAKDMVQSTNSKLNVELDRVGIEDIIIDDYTNRLATIVSKSSNITCTLFGETGTGKEEVAKLIHRRRMHREGAIPLVCVNCANINGDLAQSLLFGHPRGAFTGAEKSTDGFFADANGGILFLDEIHTLSIPTQQKLLRVVNDGTYTRLGETKTRTSKFQIIAATTRDLDHEVEAGRFIIDLRSRLFGLDINLKPLRERKQDIPALVKLYFNKHKVLASPELVARVSNRCREYYWQGNVRQLYSTLTTWRAISENTFYAHTFPENKNMLPPDHFHKQSSNSMKGYMQHIVDVVEKSILLDMPLEDALGQVEKLIISKSLELNDSITEVFTGLKVSRNNFYVKRKKYGLDDNFQPEADVVKDRLSAY